MKKSYFAKREVMTYGERVKEVRIQSKMTQEKFAEAIGLKNKQTISDLEKNKQQKLMKKNEILLIEKFNINSNYLLVGGEMFAGSHINEPAHPYGKEETISFAYYPEVYASAGGGAMVYASLAHTEPMQLSKAFVEDFLGINTNKNMHILNVKGDSMEPTILDGELIFVLPLNGDGIVDGKIYVMMYKDEIYVKRVRREAFKGTYKLSSDNVAVDDINLTEEESKDCKIIGEVIGQMRRNRSTNA